MVKHLERRMVSYADSLQADVDRVQNLIDNVRELATTPEPVRVQELLLVLNKGQISDYWVRVPRQYSSEGMYMLAFNRFLEFAGVKHYEIATDDESEDVKLVMTKISAETDFRFELADQDAVYFVDNLSEQRLFYWSLQNKEIVFNSAAMTNELVIRFKETDDAVAIRTLGQLFLQFGRFMANTLQYDVDLNMLETADEFVYELIPANVPDVILDHLFVYSNGSKFFMKRVPNGAGIVLADKVEVHIFKDDDQNWHFQVLDGQNNVSWLDVLLGYDFIADWYVSERQFVELADHMTEYEPVSNVVVETLLPRNQATV